MTRPLQNLGSGPRRARWSPCLVVLASLGALLGCSRSEGSASTPGRAISAEWSFPEARQFDFWIGRWSVVWRRLQDDGSYLEADRTSHQVWPVLRGKGIMELADGEPREDGGVTRGFSVRYFDRADGVWKMAQSWPKPGKAGFSSLEGSFRHGRGELFREFTTAEGEPYTIRYTFSDVHPARFRWDSAYRAADETCWTTDAIAEFDRTASSADWPGKGEPFPTAGDGSICPEAASRRLDFLEGAWRGRWSEPSSETEGTVRMRAWEVLDGCGVLTYLVVETAQSPLEILTVSIFLPQRDEWLALELDDRPDTGFSLRSGSFEGNELRLETLTPAGEEPGEEIVRTSWSSLGDRVVYERARSHRASEDWTVTHRATVRRIEEEAE